MENVGKAMTDIKRMSGEFEGPETEMGWRCLKEVFLPRDEWISKRIYGVHSGYGRLFCSLKGYGECHNTEEVIGQIGYDADADVRKYCRFGILLSWGRERSFVV